MRKEVDMQITVNINPKLLNKLAEEYGIEVSDLEANIAEYFKSYENDQELLEELIENSILNY